VSRAGRSFLALAAGLLTVGRTARGEDAAPPLRASIICEAPAAPGRFRCDVEARVTGATLAWADVVVVRVDDFILPLRGRVGPRDATVHDADIFRWGLGFVAKAAAAKQGKDGKDGTEKQSGDVTIRVRGVVCRGGACRPVETEASGRVIVGG